MIKYLITYQIEKLHRYCFDVIYQQDHKINFIDKIYLRILDFCLWLIPDYREYLKKWHEDKKNNYVRYKSYEW